MPIFVLQAFSVKSCATCCSANDEAAAELICSCPEGIARALESEHGVEDVDRNHWFIVR